MDFFAIPRKIVRIAAEFALILAAANNCAGTTQISEEVRASPIAIPMLY